MNETRTAEEIEADADAKVMAAVDAAITAGEVDPEQPVGVVINKADGTIRVGNVENPDAKGDRVIFPPLYDEEGRESLVDTHYAGQFAEDWGF